MNRKARPRRSVVATGGDGLAVPELDAVHSIWVFRMCEFEHKAGCGIVIKPILLESVGTAAERGYVFVRGEVALRFCNQPWPVLKNRPDALRVLDSRALPDADHGNVNALDLPEPKLIVVG